MTERNADAIQGVNLDMSDASTLKLDMSIPPRLQINAKPDGSADLATMFMLAMNKQGFDQVDIGRQVEKFYASKFFNAAAPHTPLMVANFVKELTDAYKRHKLSWPVFVKGMEMLGATVEVKCSFDADATDRAMEQTARTNKVPVASV